jgi:hypothetical protein
MENKDVLLKKLRDNYRFLCRDVVSDMPFDVVKEIVNSVSKFESSLRSTGHGSRIKKRGYVDDSLLTSSFCALFWFTGDYSDIRCICGVCEFVEADISAKTDISPDGDYSDWSDDVNMSPRGSVSVRDGKVVINVTVECPDDVLYRVVDVFGLKAYMGGKLKIVKGSYIAKVADDD